jgi:molybdopterin synthase catalytic subunit
MRGSTMIGIQTADVDIGAMIAQAKVPGTGAVVVFDGVVRDDDITEMELEAYEDVAVAELEKIAAAAMERFGLLHVSIVHRIGKLVIGENIVVIVVSAGHRHEAYDGSRFIIDELKHTVPVWKKELTNNGGRWVDGEHAHGSGRSQTE